MYLEGMFKSEEARFDAMISFSSLEHSGLGRYKYIILGQEIIWNKADVHLAKLQIRFHIL